jgi:hypothetical protein
MPALYEFTDLEEPDPGGHRYRFEPADDVREAEVDSDALHAWCTQEFGDRGGPSGSRWYAGRVIFWFRDEQDAFVFRLRWC